MAISTENKKVSFGELVASLRDLTQSGSTGTLYLLTDAKTYARIGLKQGRIAQIVVGKHRGEEALEQLGRVKSGVCSFVEGVVSGSGELPLPQTQEIIRWLEECAYASEALSDGTSAPPLAMSPGGNTVAQALDDGRDADAIPDALREVFDEADLQVLQPEPQPTQPEILDDGPAIGLTGQGLCDAVTRGLAMHIGPIAPMVIHEYRAALMGITTAGALRRVLENIAEEIDSAPQREQFVRGLMDQVSK